MPKHSRRRRFLENVIHINWKHRKRLLRDARAKMGKGPGWSRAVATSIVYGNRCIKFAKNIRLYKKAGWHSKKKKVSFIVPKQSETTRSQPC